MQVDLFVQLLLLKRTFHENSSSVGTTLLQDITKEKKYAICHNLF